MQVGTAQCVNKGMQRDYSMDKSSQEFAYENRNIRITTTGNNSFLSVTNEKSTKKISINYDGEFDTILGSTTINDYLVVFSKGESGKDYIYKIKINTDTNTAEATLLFKGDLNFNVEKPIECITAYESKDVQKVYWVDGVNQPRYINVAKNSTYPETETFNFAPLLSGNMDVTITKQYSGTGEFTSGIIQYFITLYKEYGAESNLAYESSLYYVSPKDRGGEIGEKQTCSFNIKINKNENTDFKGIKVYSMLRTSYNAEPEVKLVYEGISDSNEVNIIDEGKGIPIAPTDIIFLNRSTISASTIEQKDNTLFLGDVKTININESFVEDISSLLEDTNATTVNFIYRPLPLASSNNQLYNYSINLENPSYILKYFKPREYYRIGFQFKTNTGEWSPVLGIRDVRCNLNIKYILDETESTSLYNLDFTYLNEEPELVYVPALKFHLTSSYWSKIISKYNIVEWRAVMAEHTDSTRTVKAQGLLLPTIFNLGERYNKSCYHTPLWNLGLTAFAQHNSNIENKTLTDFPLIDPSVYHKDYDILNTVYENKGKPEYSNTSLYLHSIKAEIIGDRAIAISTQDSVRVLLYIRVATSSTPPYECNPIQIVWSHRAFGQGKKTCREAYEKAEGLSWEDIKDTTIKYDGNSISLSTIKGIDWSSSIFKGDEFPSEETLIDTFVPFSLNSETSIPTPWLVRNINYDTNETEIKKHSNEYFIDANVCNFISPDIQNVESGFKFRIIGSTTIANSISDYNIISEDSVDYKGVITNEAKYDFNLWKWDGVNTGITTFPLWPYANNMFYVSYWQHSGPLSAGWDIEGDTAINVTGTFNLKSKVYANMWYCNNTEFTKEIQYPISSIRQIHEDTNIFQAKIYKKKYENLLLPKDKRLFYVKEQNETSKLEDLLFGEISDVEVNDIKSTLIKNNSSPHCVVDLGNSNGGQYVLPNYDNVDTQGKTGILYEDFDRMYSINSSFGGGYNASYASIVNTVLLIIFPDGMEATRPLEDAVKYITRSLQTGQYWYLLEDAVGSYLEYSYKDTTIQLNTYDKYTDIEFSIHPEVSKFSEINANTCAYIRMYQGNYYMDFMFLVHRIEAGKITLSLRSFSVNKPVTINVEGENSNFTLTSDSMTSYIESENKLILTPAYNKSNTSKLWIGEFYTPYDSSTFMGGDTEAAKNSNVFIPIYGNYTLPGGDNQGDGYGLEGDTYYQRWDHLRIFPTNENDVNRPIDALSIMVETHKNLDGDVRELRGRTDTTALTEENTNNVLNDVYSQPNNYLIYSALNKKLNNSEYPSMYVWSLNKQALSTIDTWTQINLTNAAKLDEVRGKLTKIKAWNNKLIAFQDKAIALINFNNQTTISTNEGVPVQIANSGKVSGHYYITTTQGCKNKWSITESPAGVYFIDSYNKSINLLNDGITSLSTLHLFQDWINENETGVIWNPLEGNTGFKSFYDPIRKDVYFSNNIETLNFNELLDQFVSFYDYPKINTLECIDGHIYGINSSNLYKMFEGKDYCNLFESQKDYSITYKINKDSFIDKIWTSIEYRADVFNTGSIVDKNASINSEDTFDTLEVWNEYQRGISSLKGDKYPNAKCKFRIWRADIPRDGGSNKKNPDRIRNPWIMLKLIKNTNQEYRMEFHDLLVRYLQ